MIVAAEHNVSLVTILIILAIVALLVFIFRGRVF